MISKYIDLLEQDPTLAVDFYVEHQPLMAHNEIVKEIKRRQPSYHYYLVTFTLRDPSTDPVPVKKYIEKQFTHRKDTLGIVEAHIVQELTKKKTPHWHLAVKTTKYLKKDRFHYYQKKYGFIDISRNKAQTMDTMITYISKDNTPTKIV